MTHYLSLHTTTLSCKCHFSHFIEKESCGAWRLKDQNDQISKLVGSGWKATLVSLEKFMLFLLHSPT